MKGLSTKVELQCSKCGCIQKADGEKYEVTCKKCGAAIIVEQALDAFNAGTATRYVKIDNNETFDTLYERGISSLNAADFGYAQMFLAKALEKSPESAVANWAMCRAVMCVNTLNVDPSVYMFVKGEKKEAIQDYALRNHSSEVIAEYNIEETLKKVAKYTDEETDTYMEVACETASDALKKEIEDQYSVYAYRASKPLDEAEGENTAVLPEMFRTIKPSFGQRKSVFDWKTIAVFIFGLLASVASIVMIACDLSNGWTIALLVIGIFIFLVGMVSIVMDSRRREICMVIIKYSPSHVDDVVTALFKVTDSTSLERGRMTVVATVRSLVRANNLIGIGIEDGQDFVYYDECGNVVEILHENKKESIE